MGFETPKIVQPDILYNDQVNVGNCMKSAGSGDCNPFFNFPLKRTVQTKTPGKQNQTVANLSQGDSGNMLLEGLNKEINELSKELSAYNPEAAKNSGSAAAPTIFSNSAQSIEDRVKVLNEQTKDDVQRTGVIRVNSGNIDSTMRDNDSQGMPNKPSDTTAANADLACSKAQDGLNSDLNGNKIEQNVSGKYADGTLGHTLANKESSLTDSEKALVKKAYGDLAQGRDGQWYRPPTAEEREACLKEHSGAEVPYTKIDMNTEEGGLIAAAYGLDKEQTPTATGNQTQAQTQSKEQSIKAIVAKAGSDEEKWRQALNTSNLTERQLQNLAKSTISDISEGTDALMAESSITITGKDSDGKDFVRTFDGDSGLETTLINETKDMDITNITNDKKYQMTKSGIRELMDRDTLTPGEKNSLIITLNDKEFQNYLSDCTNFKKEIIDFCKTQEISLNGISL